jgi:aminopeptidase N
MEEVSGVDLETFFEQWVYHAGYPRLRTTWTVDETSGNLSVTIEQLQPELFEFPLEIEVTGDRGQEFVRRFRVAERKERYEIELDGGLRTVRFDPNTNLLAEIS